MEPDTIRINPKDNVSVALRDITKGSVVKEGNKEVTVLEDVGRGHKIALSDINTGAPVIKYGNQIGLARDDIKAGSWVHTHNVRTALSETTGYKYEPVFYELPKPDKVRGEPLWVTGGNMAGSG